MTKKQTRAKRALSSFLALILTLTVIVTSGITASAATSGTVTIIGAGHDFYYWNSSVTYYNKILGKNITQASGECIAQFQVLNQPYYSFCINFGLHSKSGVYTGSETNSYFDRLSYDQRNRMAMAQYYGYPANENKGFNASQGHESYVTYAATQLLIWEWESGIRDVNDYSYSPSNTNCLINHISGTGTYSYNELKAKYLSILGKAEAFTQRPSFTAKDNSTATTYTLKYNASKNRYEYTFSADSQISKFNLSNIKSAGLGYELNGNTLTVHSASSFTGTKSAKIEKSIDQTVLNDYKGIFWTSDDPNLQVLMGGVGADPVSAFLKFATEPTGSIAINKIFEDIQGNDKTATKTQYADLKFKIKNKASGKYITVKSNDSTKGTYSYSGLSTSGSELSLGTESNTISVDNLPVGSYEVTETKGTNGFEATSSTYTVTVSSNATATVSFTNKEQSGKLEIKKYWEKADGTAIPDISAVDTNAKKAVYFYVMNDSAEFIIATPANPNKGIYNATGKTTNKASATKFKLATDNMGDFADIQIKGLKLGDYYISEYFDSGITPTYKYTLNETAYAVSLTAAEPLVKVSFINRQGGNRRLYHCKKTYKP